MPKMAPSARKRTHTHKSTRSFCVSFTSGPHEYTQRRFSSFWQALGYWWTARREPYFENVKWEINYGNKDWR